jgi:hypothetical protein
LLLFHGPFRKAIPLVARFSLLAVGVALPWYIRNAIFMGNPFYPFVFGGRYWDSFLASSYAAAGTGIGWDMSQILLAPLNIILGTHVVSFFDGRLGPLFLILAPFTAWILLSRTDQMSVQRQSLLTIGVFSLLSFAAWMIGIINSGGLWQARLLFPVMMPFAIPTALAWDSLKRLDTSKLHISFVMNVIVAIVVALTIIDNAVFVIQRNPLAVAVGVQSRARYIERTNPSYAALMTFMDTLTAEARVYSLFEPRSYNLPRQTQPDALLTNFAHDIHLYQTPNAIIRHWKAEQFTHVLVYERGREFILDFIASRSTPGIQNILQETLSQLTLLAQTPDKVYTIYKIP